MKAGQVICLAFCFNLFQNLLRTHMEAINYITPASLIGCSEQIILNKLPSTITTYCFSPDGQTLLIADDKEEVWRWDRATKELEYFITPFPGHSVSAIAFTSDGRYIAFGSQNTYTLVIANSSSGEVKAVYDIALGCKQIVFHPEARLLAILTSGSLGIMETYTGCLLHKEQNDDLFGLEAHNIVPVIQLAWVDSGDQLLTCTSNGVLRKFCPKTGEITKQVELKREIQTLLFNSDSSLGLATCKDRALVIDTNSLRTTTILYGIKPNRSFSTSFADAGFRVGHLNEATNMLYTYSTQECFMFPGDQKPEREFDLTELSKGTVAANTVLFSQTGDYCLCLDRNNRDQTESTWLLVNL